VATEYDEQRLSLRALRLDQPQPPRDLWARTSAAIETQPSRRRRVRRRRFGALAYAPLIGALVVAIVVGSSVFDRVFPPLGSTTKGDDPEATPFALAAGEIQLLNRNSDGTVDIFSKQLDQVCPVGADSCGLSDTLDVTHMGSLGSKGQLDAIVSPDHGQMVVVERGSDANAVYVLPLKTTEPAASTSTTPSDTPDHTPATTPEATPATSATTEVPSASPSDGTEVTPSPTDDQSPSATPTSSDEPPASASTSPDGSASPTDSAAPSDTPTATPEPSAGPATTPEPTHAPATAAPSAAPASPSPSVEVTPGPDGAIEIAHDVVIVGSVAAYSPDGTRFAFSARPADGSQGPDVYVWRVGDREANAVTTDHGTQLAGWIGDRLLVSRAVDGTPRTSVLNLADDSQRVVSDGAMWRPTIGPGRKTAAWWDGAVKKADDDVTWVPERGRLVLDAWPNGAGDPQVLAEGPISDWDVQWDDSGTELAVWVARDGGVGKLSLYAIDPATGRADLDHPHLDAVPAIGGFALEPGRLAWSAPDQGGDTSVEVLAWSGNTFGRVSLPTENGSTIVH
jgi:hypothetical protein